MLYLIMFAVWDGDDLEDDFYNECRWGGFLSVFQIQVTLINIETSFSWIGKNGENYKHLKH